MTRTDAFVLFLFATLRDGQRNKLWTFFMSMIRLTKHTLIGQTYGDGCHQNRLGLPIQFHVL